jgi:hypothetical protein
MGVFGESRAGVAAEGEGDRGGRADVSQVLRLAPGTGAVLRTPSGPSGNYPLLGRRLPGRISKPGFPTTTSTYTDDFNHGYLPG